MMDPAHPGLKFHKIHVSKDHNFSSVRVSRDIRLIVHKTANNLLLCYVGHHDDAYRWAERRKIEIHPKTGAAQLVEVRERVQEIPVPRYVEAEPAALSKPTLFDDMSEEELLGYGVPEEWLEDVQQSDETHYWSWPTTCLPKQQKHFSNWRPAEHHRWRQHTRCLEECRSRRQKPQCHRRT